ncbi:2,3-bisphosphoglycerate-independent phosphoglycerate mutase [Peptoniphilus catoniae]|uniref:2,3-bisphosphoglycerate-independent phosphoglycerate mutase n=1 Tax=Peptoniphilus catoniae TaxID=1660341 RepID=UPI0010FE1D10|nr:2,3-bisphosphoglycerate-independent phosphoglycerate mutase [Peptoniphilus catoniae]
MKPVMLIILDGFGLGKDYEGNAVKLAKKETIDRLYKTCPYSQLLTSGEAVGLPEGQMGNSEVGHLNIGSGRVVYQDLSRISNSIKNGSFFENKVLKDTMKNALDKKSALHLMGLLSKGGVHSHMDHLVALVKMAKKEGLKDVYIHGILDGRDVAPDSGLNDIKEFEEKLADIGIGKIVTLSGRYYAMDRDKRWDRTKLYYDDVTESKGESYESAEDLIIANYERKIFDEFVVPGYIKEDGKEPVRIKEDDSLIFFNFRPDRARQIVRAFQDENFEGFKRDRIRVYMTTLTEYDTTIPHTHIAFEEIRPEKTLGEILAREGKRQLRIAETEKYAHVTFFFNGGRETPYKGEDRVLVPSPKVATYDLKPEMSAYEVTDELIKKLDERVYDCIILNFANTDMVGHTGSLEAAVKAVEAVDKCLNRILNKLDQVGGGAIITADHGNCEEMIAEDGSPVTSHTTNPVPVFLYGGKGYKISQGALCDIAPTILELLAIEKPVEMTGKSLLIKE